MGKFMDLTGMRFGRLTAQRQLPKTGKKTYWECTCECGKEISVSLSHLRTGHTQSCGCLKADRPNNLKHGQAVGNGSAEYRTWVGIKSRCQNPNTRSYKDYGGRGIAVCARWLASFELFLQDLGLRPSGMSIDRIDVNGNYEPSNCRWATSEQQQRNKRGSKCRQ